MKHEKKPKIYNQAKKNLGKIKEKEFLEEIEEYTMQSYDDAN